jgi:CRP-like cAMP-binding protein
MSVISIVKQRATCHVGRVADWFSLRMASPISVTTSRRFTILNNPPLRKSYSTQWSRRTANYSSKCYQRSKSTFSSAKRTKQGGVSRRYMQKGTLAFKQQQQWHQQQARQNLSHDFPQDVISFVDRMNMYLNRPRALPIPRWISPERSTISYSEVFGHASFVLVAVSYAVDDFVLLRLIAIAGSTAMLVFTYFHPHGKVLWLPFRWNLLFIGLNSWRVAKVHWDRYWSDQLMAKTICRRIYDHHFYVMEKTDFARMVRLGAIETYKKGDVVVRQGQDNRYVRLVLKGDLQVDRDGQITYTLHEGQFISESGLHAGLGLRGSVESCCTVTAESDDVEVLCWDRTELMRLLEMHKSIERALKAVMSWDIVSKLKSQRALLASGRIDDVEYWTQKRREQTLSRYKAILHNMLAHPDYLNKRKEQLAKYRDIHHIEMSEHILALKEMNWTMAEFEAGVKEGQLNEDKIERKQMGLRWWLRAWWNAL